jgi:hypothetical protein
VIAVICAQVWSDILNFPLSQHVTPVNSGWSEMWLSSSGPCTTA